MGKISAHYWSKELVFKHPVRTARGTMETHTAYYIELKQSNKFGVGEASPLSGLSIDAIPTFEQKVSEYCALINDGMPLKQLSFEGFPSLAFAFETAAMGTNSRSAFLLFDNVFLKGVPIEINGLVWMNEISNMLEEAYAKAQMGFACIKFKIGTHDFDAECRMLETFRKQFSAHKIDIRLDANGAFLIDETLPKLKELSRFGIHSIEQPIKQGQEEIMQEVCRKSAIKIALDEELIGKYTYEKKNHLLQRIQPHFIILKPTLLGGFAHCDEWIKLAKKHNINWWVTSALESNIGLNAIAQWCSQYPLSVPQGLGTGGLYTNNIASPLAVSNGYLTYIAGAKWDWQDGN
jgi:o-succinylbenzoate synthase